MVSFDTTSFPPTQVMSVTTATGDPLRADELAYDPRDGLLLVINNADTPPFGTFIKVNKSTCASNRRKPDNRLMLRTASMRRMAPSSRSGSASTGRFYLSIPQIGPTVSNGGVVRIAPDRHDGRSDLPGAILRTGRTDRRPTTKISSSAATWYSIRQETLDPAGNVTAAPQDVIIDAKTGKKDRSALDANVLGVGAGDEVWYNSGDNNYYATGSGSPFRPLPAATAQGSTPLGVVDARDQTVLQLLTTFNVPAVTTGSSQHPAGTSHSVAANAANNHVLVPIPANNAFPDCLTGCIAVFAHPDEDRPRRRRIAIMQFGFLGS